jgi:hypothetical protein
MSLKGFHILFIALAFLCAAGFWAWCLWNGDTVERLRIASLGNLSGSLAIALFIYGLWFVLKKSRTIIV